MKKLRWGILSTSAFARKKMIPALLQCQNLEVYAVASRDSGKASETARAFHIPVSYGSYDELLTDKQIDVVYIALPNHLHAEWTIRCLEHKKHVLCEKPLALSLADVRKMIAARNKSGMKAGEAFMVKTHPQWLKVKEIIEKGNIGELRMIHGFFSYYKDDPTNIRNIASYGGGGLWDIGCYCTMLSRFVLNREPNRVMALIDYDPSFKIDRLTSAILDFNGIHATFTCATQLVPHQRMHFFGTRKHLEVNIPFNSPPDKPVTLSIDDGQLPVPGIQTITIDACDQYTIEADAFSLSILKNRHVPSTFEDGFKNIAVIEALFRSAQTHSWQPVEKY